MRSFALISDSAAPRRVLVLGAHSDDAEIGAGGTIRSLLQGPLPTQVRWVIFSAAGEREQEARASAAETISGAAEQTVEVHAFRDGFFPYEGALIKDVFELLKASYEPDVILTHHRDDLHQDHKVVAELTWNTFRNHTILEYEVPKYDGGLGSPNFFVPLSAELVDAKVEGLLRCFVTQRQKSWFTAETFKALLRLRGIECQSKSGYAEAFYVRKAVWAPGLRADRTAATIAAIPTRKGRR
jgi:LmbE family N-acetylglucosaminyl deacetylase